MALPQPRSRPSAFSVAPAQFRPLLSAQGGRVICLSTTVRNDTLQEVKEHRVSLKCRKQLRVEELEMVMLWEHSLWSQEPQGRV